MAEIKINNMVKFYTLCLLATDSKHGYDLIKELEKKLGRRISASNVYPFLSTLRKNKLIKFDKVGKRDKKTYHLTSSGKSFTKQMFSKFGDLINIAIEPRITACPCGCKIYSGGYAKTIRGNLIKFCCSHCAGEYK
ncbi:PadR family transcriptional regulator [Candidatus Woesearchaeota archaeon]|nr:PadR family transcriptional regulator [Candidatus Woesearchaeota archaeon]